MNERFERVERALQVTVVIMAALGTTVLGMGQQSVVLPLIAVFVAATSLYFTDIRGWLRLNRNVANLAAILAVLVSVSDFFRMERDSQLLAIANLLIYLQIVLMYQQKESRVYWQLLMLSLLQVVVAAALNFGVLFGVLLLIYMFLGLLALLLFFAYREQERLLTDRESPAHPAGLFERVRRTPQPIAVVRQSVPRDADLLGGGLPSTVLRFGLVTLAVSGVVFFLVPRFGEEAWSERGQRVQRVVGFSDQVELGSLGTAYQNPSAVMRVWFTDPHTRLPYRIEGEPLFRGAVVNHYERGKWRQHRSRRIGDPVPLPLAPDTGDMVLQNFTLMPLNEETVFAIHPAYVLDVNDRQVRYDRSSDQLIRIAHYERSDFTLGTRGYDRGMQRPITPVRERLRGSEELQLWQLPEAIGEPFPELARLAARIVAESGVDPNDRIATARVLSDYLANSGEFDYTLTGVARDPALDPIEDFISNNRVGHCEYFSTALTLMLRTQRIPARMAIGFKGGEFNQTGNFFLVRQLHAHSWVEVYLAPDQVPEELLFERSLPNHGAWLTLDPTPMIDRDIDLVLTWREQIQDWLQYGEYLWSNYVVGLDARKQRETIYQPVTEGAAATARSLFTAEAWRQRWQSVRQWWRQTAGEWLRANATGWRGLPLWAALGALAWGAWRLGRLGRQYYSQWAAERRNSPAARRARSVEFYHRLESILARQGIVRPAGQTQFEFAVAVGGRLADNPQYTRHASLPRKIAETFYKVRFGGQPLSPQEEAGIENALAELSRIFVYRL